MTDLFNLFSFDEATSVVYKAQLKAATLDEVGIGAQGDLQGGNQTFDPILGMDVQPLADGNGESLRITLSIDDIADLDVFATIQFEVDSQWWEQDFSDTQGIYLWTRADDAGSGRDGHIAKINAALPSLDQVSFRASTGFHANDVTINEVGKPAKTRCYFEQDILSGPATVNTFWVDDLPIKMDNDVYVVGSNLHHTLGGAFGQGAGLETSTGGINVANFKIQSAVAKRAALGTNDTHGDFGDSFKNQGAQSISIEGNRVPWIPGYGWDQAGNVQAGPDVEIGSWDSSIIPQFYRMMYKAGVWLGNEQGINAAPVANALKNFNYSQSGSGMTIFPSGNTPLDWWNQAITDGFDPNVTSNGYGTNDATLGNAFNSTQKALFETNYLALLRAQLDYGVKGVTIWLPPTLSNQAIFDSAEFVASLASVHDSIRTVFSIISGEYGPGKIVLVDAFSALGDDPANYKDDDIHPSNLGSNILGTINGEGLLSLIISIPILFTTYTDLINDVGDIVNVDLAPNWLNPERLHFDVIQAPDSVDEITGLPGACSVQGELTARRAYQVQVKATDVFTGESTLSNQFTWSVERLAALGSVANTLSSLNGPVIGVVPFNAFDVAITALASGSDLIPRKLLARVTGDVSLVGLDGVTFTHTVVDVGIQDVGFVQINSVGTVGTIDDYEGLI